MVVASAARRAMYWLTVIAPRSASVTKVFRVTGFANLPTRIRRKLEDVRISQGHGQCCSSDFVVIGIKRGGDKAPPPSPAEVLTCLMHDSHNVKCESRIGPRILLDGFWPKPGDRRAVVPRSIIKMSGNILGRPEPCRHLDLPNPRAVGVSGPILAIDQIRMR